MSTERDELAEIIWRVEAEEIGTFKTGVTSKAADAMADAILAGGYRKPLTSEGGINESRAQQAGDQAVGTMPSMLAVPANKDMDAPADDRPTLPAKAVNEAQKAYIALRSWGDYRTPEEYAEAMLEAAAPYMMNTSEGGEMSNTERDKAGYRKETADGVMVDRLRAAVSAALALAQEWEAERANFEEIHDYSNYRISVLNNAAQKLRDAIGYALRGQK